MYQRITIFLSLIIMALLFMSNNFNPPNGKTGASFDGLCTDCHKGTNQNFAGALSLEGLPDKVVLGNTYPLELKLTISNGTPKRAGFQLVSVGNTENINAGTFIPADGTKQAVFTKKNRNYLEHQGSKNFDSKESISWQFDWTAVESLNDRNIQFYASSVIANGDGENSSDRVITNTFTIEVDTPSSIDHVENISWSIFPNPVFDILNIDIKSNDFFGKIYDIYGNTNLDFQNESQIDISQLSTGIYFVRIKNKVTKFVKI